MREKLCQVDNLVPESTFLLSSGTGNEFPLKKGSVGSGNEIVKGKNSKRMGS